MKIETTNDIMKATREELIDYALDVTSERNELKAENAELHKEVAHWKELAAIGAQNCQFDCEERKRLEELETENAELKARLEKAVELPCIINRPPFWYVLSDEYVGEIAMYKYDTREAAEARLKELEKQK